jgi:hypothetical protein
MQVNDEVAQNSRHFVLQNLELTCQVATAITKIVWLNALIKDTATGALPGDTQETSINVSSRHKSE